MLGTITDPFGETEINVKSRFEGYVIGIKSLPTVNKGDALIHIGIK